MKYYGSTEVKITEDMTGSRNVFQDVLRKRQHKSELQVKGTGWKCMSEEIQAAKKDTPRNKYLM
jgi:hypothetical protein